jgi:hypothetical protein
VKGGGGIHIDIEREKIKQGPSPHGCLDRRRSISGDDRDIEFSHQPFKQNLQRETLCKKRIMLAAVFRIHDFFGVDPDPEHWLAGKKSFFPLENTSILLGISSE